MIVTISKGQQITIPANIRSHLGLEVGSKVDIEEEKGQISIKPVGEDLEEVFEKTKNIKPKCKMSAKQMDEFNEKRMS